MRLLEILNQVWFPRIPPAGCRPVGRSILPMGSFPVRARKGKVVVVMGATGTGKSRLAIDLAVRFGGEVVNSDKMQLYDGLDVVTNKVTDEETRGIPHHLLGGVPPDADLTASDFRLAAGSATNSIAQRGWVPVVAGGSNSYIEELIDGAGREFRSRYACCFLWVDVQLKELHRFVGERVDRMVERGLVEEVRGVFDPEADYGRGIRKAIGVPEMDRYLRAEAEGADEWTKARLLEAAIDDIKANTCKLTCCQLQKINRLRTLPGWDVHRVDATEVFRKRGEEADRTWDELVCRPSLEIVGEFLNQKEKVEEREEGQEEAYFVASSGRKEGKSVLTNETVVRTGGAAAAGAAAKLASAVVVGATV
ncbi:adenylate isopentenyltransferase 5, chloroplastic-like [Phoenix dactylifera]|uniref:adenylate dimethylallyltransferase (ADP/ATP-dependent) n=1 Tax=Phoenix dactylifera TaxID=42345 RepID=A0A8B7BWQ7_PHODC|nr:adenylate isopentenyltransferase 5, chloroplastic-like [Phoenix dactylifera]